MPDQIIRSPILNPRADGTVEFLRDGVIHADSTNRIAFVGNWNELAACLGPSANVQKSHGIILPPLLDNHIHIPQHPIRGRFMEGVEANPPNGRLMAGLNRNVFPAEAKCVDREYTQRIVQDFLDDTLAKGVIGGAAYMTVHTDACAIALEMLPPTWHVGLVMMNREPAYLRTDEPNIERDIRRLSERFGNRFIVTDRFAVAVTSELRTRASKLARELDLRMQTHLNEQRREKHLVEEILYPDADSYTDVYRRDGLLERRPILAHCVQNRDEEFAMIRDFGGSIAHCPTSNTLLGSGIMKLDKVISNDIDYAICTDVGASPTTSMLHEMLQYLKVHRGRSNRATPTEALYRSTLAPSRMLGLNDLGTFEVGKPLSYIEIACDPASLDQPTVDDVILSALLQTSSRELDQFLVAEKKAALDALELDGLDVGPNLQLLNDDIEQSRRRVDDKVIRVVMDGATVWEKQAVPPRAAS
ncbi:MAG TPA: amidohydrolase family protein [Tepidisphaeraceae bacterium]|jgi:guanine deaminase|nr:amidohydrolase family protein [Tepidisphaeraceae bacterium]